MHPLLEINRVEGTPRDWLPGVCEVEQEYGANTQDSGNASFVVAVSPEQRYFVKTADPAIDAYLAFDDRVALLRNAVRIAQDVAHPTRPMLLNVIESDAGPMLVYEWVAGELLRSAEGRGGFAALEDAEALAAYAQLLDLHVALAAHGWVAGDFYDGCLIYDFERFRLQVVDLDSYHLGPHQNEMGRMFGSERFMAPEEFELGAVIDERTTVFNLGRAAAVLLSDRERFNIQRAVIEQACASKPGERFATVAELNAAWLKGFQSRTDSRGDY